MFLIASKVAATRGESILASIPMCTLGSGDPTFATAPAPFVSFVFLAIENFIILCTCVVLTKRAGEMDDGMSITCNFVV